MLWSRFVSIAHTGAMMSTRVAVREPRARSTMALLFATAVTLLAACASPYPPAPRDLTGADYNYLIGPLDTLNIIVWRNPELSLTVPVRPDGRVAAPLVDD